MENKCAYCYQPRTDMEGWHDCKASVDAKARMEATIDGIMRIAHNAPETGPMTSMQMRERADRRRDTAASVRLAGGKTKPEYDPIDLTESDYNGRE